MEAPTIAFLEKSQLANVEGIAGSWSEPIYKYVRDEILLTDNQQSRKMRVRAARYVIIDGVLFY